MRKAYQITEYGSFVRDKEVLRSTSLPPDTFDALENFVLSNSTDDADALELMGISARKGVGKIITAKNYVGVITMDDGTTIEILPEDFFSRNDCRGQSQEATCGYVKDTPQRTVQVLAINQCKHRQAEYL